ncbi:unnamed protein product [Caenorhabditis sp. 36 PRJEB53466]|nr:unnamed protein product [Caenorhabditis sp. 36 PRJEB53466]
MKRWLEKITSPLKPQEPSSDWVRDELYSGTPTAVSRARWSSAYASDPTEWERLFETKWSIVNNILERKLGDPEHKVVYDELMALLENMTNMCTLLMLEANSQPEPIIGPILDKFFTEQILERVLDWAIQLTDSLKSICQLAIIRIFEMIVSDSHSQNHCLLVHKPILNPLFRLCEWFQRADVYWRVSKSENKKTSEAEKMFVLLLNQICTKLVEDRTLLHFFFHSNQFVVFTELIPFLYSSGDTGQLARDAVLLILSVSAEDKSIAEYVTERTSFCQVLTTGLSACFSQLPRRILGDGGERLVEDSYREFLADYHSALLFCNAIAQMAHSEVVENIASFFYTGFLTNVIKPAFLQNDREYIGASMVYLQMCIETIVEPVLVRSIVQMILTERDDNGTLFFEIVISYVKGGDKTSVTALSLIDALLKLACEDVMLALVFRPLLTNHSATKKQLSIVYKASRGGTLSQTFLNCIPLCMHKHQEVASLSLLSSYMYSTRIRMDARADQCRGWKWKYDGMTAGSFCLPAESDDDATCHVSFSRMSSNRSSVSMTPRYSRGSHPSHIFNINKAGPLGPKPTADFEDVEDDLEEDEDFILPPIETEDEMTSSKVMTQSTMDYMHISGLDGSESDDALPVRVEEQSETDTDVPKSSFVLSGWRDVQDMDTFKQLLSKQEIKGEQLPTNEIVDFINKKYDSLKLGESETVEEEKEEPKKEEPTEHIVVDGFSIYNFPERSKLLQTILEGVETLCENELPFNTELISLIADLATYPQPLLAYYLFDPKEDDSEKHLLQILQSVQTRIDVMAEGIEAFDTWIENGLKTLEARASRIRNQSATSPRTSEEHDPTLFYGRSTMPPPGRKLLIREPSRQETIEDQTARRTALAAILLAHLCQMLAAIVLQQALII